MYIVKFRELQYCNIGTEILKIPIATIIRLWINNIITYNL